MVNGFKWLFNLFKGFSSESTFLFFHQAGFLTRPFLQIPSRNGGRYSGLFLQTILMDLQQRGLLPAYTAFPSLMRAQI
jgi:hypothetical protein